MNVLDTHLSLDTEKRGEETSNPDSSKVLGGEVTVESLELVQCQHNTEQIDQDPQSIENIVPIRTLVCKYFPRDLTI